MCICLCISKYSLLKGHGSCWTRTLLNNLILIWLSCEDTISKWSHILNHWGLGPQHIIGGEKLVNLYTPLPALWMSLGLLACSRVVSAHTWGQPVHIRVVLHAETASSWLLLHYLTYLSFLFNENWDLSHRCIVKVKYSKIWIWHVLSMQ